MIAALREEVFPEGFTNVNFRASRSRLREADLHARPSAPCRAGQGVARIYERFHGKRLRRRCREALVGRIRWELRSSGHTSISPVSGFLNILALWLLCNTQDADGTWPKQDMAGVFFRTALLDYALYRQYFPLHALALYEARRRKRTRRAGSGLSEARHDLGHAQREQEGPGCQGELQSSAVGSQA